MRVKKGPGEPGPKNLRAYSNLPLRGGDKQTTEQGRREMVTFQVIGAVLVLLSLAAMMSEDTRRSNLG